MEFPGGGLGKALAIKCQSSVTPKCSSLRSEPAHLLWVRMCFSIRLNLSEVPEELLKAEKQDMEHRTLFLSLFFFGEDWTS